MADETAWFKFPFPSKDADPWFDEFEAFTGQVDDQIFALHDERNQIVHGGGTIEWDGTTLSWNADVVFISPTHGMFQTLVAGSVDIADGEFWYVSLARGPTTAMNVTSDTAVQTEIDGSVKVLAYNADGVLYFWTGLMLEDGKSSVGFVPRPITGRQRGRWRYAEIPVSPGDLIEAYDWAHEELDITKITVMMVDAPTTMGSYTLRIQDEAGNDVIDGSTFDLTSLVTGQVTVVPLTEDGTTHMMQGEKLLISADSDNPDLTGDGLYIVVEWLER